MLGFLTTIFVAAVIAWIVEAITFIGTATQPGGMIAAYATLNQLGTATLIVVICGGVEVVAKRLDRLNGELVAMREIAVRQASGRRE